jgi:3-oxoacyl-[acyl-carrier protein] reductase
MRISDWRIKRYGRAICVKLAGMNYFVLVNYKNNEVEAKKTQEQIKEQGGKGELLRFDAAR